MESSNSAGKEISGYIFERVNGYKSKIHYISGVHGSGEVIKTFEGFKMIVPRTRYKDIYTTFFDNETIYAEDIENIVKCRSNYDLSEYGFEEVEQFVWQKKKENESK